MKGLGSSSLARVTSIEAYQAIKSSGRLKGLKLEAYRLVCYYGPGTAREIGAKSLNDGLWKRFSELQKQGLIEEVGTRLCQWTGRNAIVWRAKWRQND